jgi:hypothetical protein
VKLHARLRKLEKAVSPGQCPECRNRHGRTVLVDAGCAATSPDLAPCPRCGAVPETIIVIEEEVVECRG